MVTVRLDNVSVSLARRPVLHDVTATLYPGMLIGIIGPNGAGKSTLVRTVLGLLRPDQGTVQFDDRSLGDLARRDIAQTLAYLPQGQTLHWPLSVERLVALGRIPHLSPMSRLTEQDRDAVGKAMARANVLHLRDRTATELSGGERARVMLARALAVGAPGLIADEPLAALDPGHQFDVMDLLASEARSGNLVIAVLHDLTMAARYCDRIVMLDQGRIVAEGDPQKVLSAARLKEVYGIEASVDLTHGWPLVVPVGRVMDAE